MQRLDSCPACGAGRGAEIFTDNDLTGNRTLPEALWRSEYTLCGNCGLIYAAWRQETSVATPYYDLFPELEHRSYGVYPPPEGYRNGKLSVARWIAGILEANGLLDEGRSLLHIRCDFGSLAQELAKTSPGIKITGGDYFESNVRFARESGNLEDVYLLDPAGIETLPGKQFDIVVVNHMFTHAIDLQSDLKACLAMLKPGGTMFVYNEIDFMETVNPGGRYFRLAPVNNYHKQLFTPGSIRRFFEHAGLELRSAERRKNTLSFILTRREGAAGKPATIPTAELSLLKARLERWGGYRRSWIRSAMRLKPVRAAYRRMAKDPAPLPY